MHIIALTSQASGSGKNILASHLAVQAQLHGTGAVVLIDADPSAMLYNWWSKRQNRKHEPFFARSLDNRIMSDIDYLEKRDFKIAIVNLPPVLRPAHLPILQKAHLAIIPTKARMADMMGIAGTAKLCKRANNPILFVINDTDADSMSDHDMHLALGRYGVIAPVHLSHCNNMDEIFKEGMTMMECDDHHPYAVDMRTLWRHALSRVERNFRLYGFQLPAKTRPFRGERRRDRCCP